VGSNYAWSRLFKLCNDGGDHGHLEPGCVLDTDMSYFIPNSSHVKREEGERTIRVVRLAVLWRQSEAIETSTWDESELICAGVARANMQMKGRFH